ncbi:macrophage mannose receptor 1-like [Engraulis encrasicolus]|uniref:macrophage mannose receptor 1-like n=1 Tax=Engraulis encrasicolus TaxID=184585 RepID=UPI002FD0E016
MFQPQILALANSIKFFSVNRDDNIDVCRFIQVFLSASTEMGTSLWLMLLFPGLCATASSVTRQFHVVKEEKTWEDARQHCREKFTDLATIDNMAEMEKLHKIIQEEGATEVWIGLNYGSSPKWQWSLADRDFYGENETEFRNWASRQPMEVGGDCAVIGSLGQWYNRGCAATYTFICYDDNLVLVTKNKTWMDALQYCREHHEDLVSVTSEQMQRWVEGWAKGASSAHVWLGLRYECSLGFWFWVNGYAVCYSNWAPDAESEFCCEPRGGAVEQDGGKWFSLDENEKLNFICTKKE